VQRLAAMTLKEASQNVVQKLSGVDCLQVERRFAARFEVATLFAQRSDTGSCRKR
jgi:hypothetical protein